MKTKAGFVTILGLPNAGKSTLMNALLGEQLSIATNKPQTTRKKILGILSEPKHQIVFLDTPGILNPQYLLQEKMLDYVFHAAKETDVIVFIVDIAGDKSGKKLFENESVKKILYKEKCPKIVVLNKIDESDEKIVNNLIKKVEKDKNYDGVVAVSALKNFNIDALKEKILDYLPVHPKFFPDDQLTDETERFFVSEIIRGKIFEIYRDEVPYSAEVLIEDFKEREKGKDYISAAIVVEKDSQKPIIIGNKGSLIKKLGNVSREAIEEFLQRQVYLELRVKVRNKWRSNPNLLKNFGYQTGNE